MNVTKENVSRILSASFPGKTTRSRWYMDNVFDPADVMLLVKGGNAVSTLTMTPCHFEYAGTLLPLAYFCNIATMPQLRGKGYMGELMRTALNAAHSRGDAFAAVVPTYDRQYFFYDKFGFSTVVYVDRKRYTSVHHFAKDVEYESVPPSYEILNALEGPCSSIIVHTRRQYEQICESIRLDHGLIAAAVDRSDGSAAAIAFAVPSRDGTKVNVREIMAVNQRAADTVLAQISDEMPGLQMSVDTVPGMRRVALRARGMMRLVNVGKVLAAMSRRYPETEQVIRVHDSIIPANNGVYILHAGKCEHVDATLRRLTLDVDVRVLTAILFSSSKVSEVFGLHTGRAMISLMPQCH